MNESESQVERERRQLELATSRTPPQDFDDQTLALREGWNILSASLEKNAPPLDEAVLLAKIRQAAPRQHAGWMVAVAILSGALAASLLLIAASRFAQQPLARPAIEKSGDESLANSAAQESPLEIAPSHGWDDPLDSQISLAASQMQSLQQPALPLDASISTLNYQLKQMAQDLEEGAL